MTGLALLSYYDIFERGLFLLVALCSLVGAVIAATIRPDAYTAGDRQQKWVWVGLLVVSALAIATHFPFLSWIGMVILGVFWFDVYPQLKALVRGDYRWD